MEYIIYYITHYIKLLAAVGTLLQLCFTTVYECILLR